MKTILVPKQITRRGHSRSYEGVAEELRKAVRDGRWAPGSMLPSRIALSQQFGVSGTTLQQAIAQLIGEGLLTADGGRGTFVANDTNTTLLIGDASRSNFNGFFGEGSRDLPVSLLDAVPAGLNIGILDCSGLFSGEAIRSDGHRWVDSIATQLENCFDARAAHASWFIPTCPNHRVSIRAAAEQFRRESLDALVIIDIFHHSVLGDRIESVLSGLPSVFISWRPVPAAIPHVYYDNRAGGYAAMEHLVRQGYSCFAFAGMDGQIWSEDRYAGALDFRHESALDRMVLLDSQWLDEADTDPVLDRWLTDRLQRSEPGNFAIVAANDWMAMRILDVASRRGLEAGRDFGIIGFDNDPRSRQYRLTTQRPPLDAMARQAAAMLFNQLRGDRTEIGVRLRPELLPRASTRSVRE